jgi:hypothetical protein
VGLLDSKNLDALPDAYLSRLPSRDTAWNNTITASVPNPFYPLLPGTSTSNTTVGINRLLTPYPQFSGMTMQTNQGYSWYHALQMTVQRRFSHGFTFNVIYTRSKMMQATTYLNAGDPVPYREISLNDQPNHFSITGIYELPFGKGRRWLSSTPAPVRVLLSGWQVSPVYQQWTGQPLGFGDFIYYGNTANIRLPADQRTLTGWFNTNGFERSTVLQFVNHYRTAPEYFSSIRGPSLHSLDLSAVKYTNLTEKIKMQFRAEAFNALNHPSFGSPNTTVTSSAFGQITSEINFERQVQFGFKVVF